MQLYKKDAPNNNNTFICIYVYNNILDCKLVPHYDRLSESKKKQKLYTNHKRKHLKPGCI